MFNKQLENLFGNVSFKHQKTIDDLHTATVIQIKFCGDLQKDIQVISCDVSGTGQVTTFTAGMLSFNVNKQLLMKTRLGAVYTLAPLLDYAKQNLIGANNPYMKNKEEKN